MPAQSRPNGRKQPAHTSDTVERLWTVAELSEYLRVPPATLYNWRCRGIGPTGIRIGKYVRYRRADVEQWLRDLELQAS